MADSPTHPPYAQAALPPVADGEATPIVANSRGSAQDYQATSSHGGPSTDNTRPRRRKRDEGQNYSTGSAGGPVHEDNQVAEAESWWKKLVDKYGAVELENKGSVARDHLALERTFLAWLRTSLSFASIGIAVTQLFRLNTTITDSEGLTPVPGQDGATRLRQLGKPLGATFLGISILVLLIGWRRYFESQYWIIKGKFPASRGSIILITFAAGALIVSSLITVILVNPTQFEKRAMNS